jgi:hypothetical protein
MVTGKKRPAAGAPFATDGMLSEKQELKWRLLYGLIPASRAKVLSLPTRQRGRTPLKPPLGYWAKE